MFETGPYLRLYYGASGDMPAHGVQGLAGEYPMLVCNCMGWCIPKLVSILRLQADSQNRVVACVIMRCACRYIATPVLLDAYSLPEN